MLGDFANKETGPHTPDPASLRQSPRSNGEMGFELALRVIHFEKISVCEIPRMLHGNGHFRT